MSEFLELTPRTQYEWCSCGSLEAIIDPAGNQTTFMRDVQGRVTDKIYADNRAWTFAYESRTGRLKSILDAKGQRTNYQYRVDDRLTSVSYDRQDGQPLAVATPGVSYGYDTAYGRVNSLTDALGSASYLYNPITVPAALGAGRLGSIDGP